MVLSKISIKRPVGMAMIALAIALIGGFFLSSLSVDLLPRITYPMVRIIVDWKGAAAEEVEQNITRKIEAGVATTEDAVNVQSFSIEGNCTIEVYFEYGKNMDVALADTKSKLDQVRRDLPPGIEEPNIYKADPSQLPITEIAFFSKTKDEREIRDWLENDLSNYFMGIPGLGAVRAYGGKVREIQVIFNQEALRRLELSTDQVLNRLKSENIDFPSGRIVGKKKEYSVRLMAKFKSIEDIKNVIVSNRMGRVFKIRDVARVIDTHEEQRLLTTLNGKPSTILSFFKQPNGNTVSIANRVEKRLRELKRNKVIPADTIYQVISSQAYYIKSSIENVGVSAAVGGLLAIFIIWLFLHTVKRTLVIAISIPVSLLGTFILMWMADVTLNIFSLGGLVLAVGMLVDNSIVMLENITRHQRDSGENALTAAENAGAEVGGALVASTLTNLAAIIPFFFIKGITALLFRDMVITIIAAFIISLFVSLTVVPSLAAHLFKNKKEEKPGMAHKLIERAVAFYRRVLGFVLKVRLIAVAVTVLIFAFSLYWGSTLGSVFLPKVDDGRVMVRVKMPVGTALVKNTRLSEKIEKIARTMPGVKTVSAIVGGYLKRRNYYEQSHMTDMTIELIEKEKRPIPTQVFVKKLQKKLKKLAAKEKGTKIKVVQFGIRGIKKSSTSDIDVRIKGPDLTTLFKIAVDIEKKLKSIQGLSNLDISVDFNRPEMHVFLNRERLSDLSLTAQDVAAALRTAVDGSVFTQFTDRKMNVDYDIRVLADPSRMRNKTALENIVLYPPTGVEVRLREVAVVKMTKAPIQIDREDQVRLLAVTCDVIDGNIGKMTEAVKKKLAAFPLPAGYHIEYGGEEQAARESNQQLMVVIVLALFLVFVVMAVQYESLLDPVIIMLTVPLSLIGAVLFLAITRTPIGATVVLGMILLIGIVINNAIIMVEYINQLRRDSGVPTREAVIEGAALRLRPILMTSITTMIGLLPLALGWGEGLEMLKPLAITFVGGMLVATFLTLFIIPCIYTLFHRKN